MGADRPAAVIYYLPGMRVFTFSAPKVSRIYILMNSFLPRLLRRIPTPRRGRHSSIGSCHCSICCNWRSDYHNFAEVSTRQLDRMGDNNCWLWAFVYHEDEYHDRNVRWLPVYFVYGTWTAGALLHRTLLSFTSVLTSKLSSPYPRFHCLPRYRLIEPLPLWRFLLLREHSSRYVVIDSPCRSHTHCAHIQTWGITLCSTILQAGHMPHGGTTFSNVIFAPLELSSQKPSSRLCLPVSSRF
jgi:hypothetical protein